MNTLESLLHAELEIELLKNKQIALENKIDCLISKIDYLTRVVESTDIRYDLENIAEENERINKKLLENIVQTTNTFNKEFIKDYYEDKKKRKELENQLAKSLES
jgi:formyltetrahydrofolate hydrolase